MADVVWASLPRVVRQCAEAELGAPVTGYSPAASAVERPADRPAGIARSAAGDRLFLKAARSHDAFAIDYRTEARVVAALPNAVPTPRLRLAAEQDGWTVLGFDAATGRLPAEPWRLRQLRGVIDVLDDAAPLLAGSSLSDLPTVADRMAGRCTTYRELACTGARDELQLADLSAFEHHHLDRLATLESTWEHRAAGPALLHFDLRHDNILVHDTVLLDAPARSSDGVTILDWGRACTGQAWIDTVCLLLLSDTGAVQPEDLFGRSARAAGADTTSVDAFLVALASYWRHAAARPVSQQGARMRARRHASGEATVRWLRARWT